MSIKLLPNGESASQNEQCLMVWSHALFFDEILIFVAFIYKKAYFCKIESGFIVVRCDCVFMT